MISEYSIENSRFQESLNEQLDNFSKNIKLSECYADLTIDSIDLALQFEEWEEPVRSSLDEFDFIGNI